MIEVARLRVIETRDYSTLYFEWFMIYTRYRTPVLGNFGAYGRTAIERTL